MKSLIEILNEGITIRPKFEYRDFDNARDALNWLEDEDKSKVNYIANININGKTGQLSFGLKIYNGNKPLVQDPDRLFLICAHLDASKSDLTDEYIAVVKPEIVSDIERLITKYGDK